MTDFDTIQQTTIPVEEFRDNWIPELEKMGATEDDLYSLVADGQIDAAHVHKLWETLSQRKSQKEQDQLRIQEMMMNPSGMNDPSLNDPMASAREVDPSDEAFFTSKG